MTAPNGQNSSSSEENDDNGKFDADAAAQQALAEAARNSGDSSSDDDDDEESGETWDQEKARNKIAKANREAKNLRDQIKQLKPLADEAEKARKDGQSEAQRLTEQKAELEVRIAEMEAADARRSAADQAGLSPQFVKFISAADPDEALVQAKELAKALKSATGEDKKADLRQGNRGSGNASGAASHDDLLRAMARGL